MSNFTPTVPYETDFEGDTVTMQLSRLKKGALLKLAPHIKGELNKDGEIIMEFEDQTELLTLLDETLIGAVNNFNGLKTGDGKHIPLEEMVKEGYFMSLSADILGQLFKITQPTKGKPDVLKDDGEAGNLKGQEQSTSEVTN